MSSNETKVDEMSYVQGSPRMLATKKCDVQENTDQRQREADNGARQSAEADNETGQPIEEDNGTGQPAEGDNVTGQPAEGDNGTGQPAGGDNGTGQQAEGDNGTGQPAEGDNGTGQLAEGDNGTGQPAEENEADELPLHIEQYRWPLKEEDLDGRNVVVIAIDCSKETCQAFSFYMHELCREDDLVVFVHAMDIGQKLRPGLVSKEDWDKETQGILTTRRVLHSVFRKFFDTDIGGKLNGAIVSRKGVSGEVIIKEAEKRRAAYVIIGKRKQDANLQHAVTKSTSDFVVCNANCPVFVCKTDSFKKPSPKAETSSSSSSSSSSSTSDE